jgi:Bacterial Ig-like domain (group 2)/Regulator of chromosome condensation (RCC1) repeat
MRRRRAVALLVCVLAAAGCKDSQEPLAPAAQIVVGPQPGTLVVGDTLQLQVRVLDAHGDALRGRTIAWASSDPGIATVSTKGLVNVVSAGTVEISAASEAVAGSVTIAAVAPLIATEIFAGAVSFNSCALTPSGSLWCWGQNFGAALGIGVTGGIFKLPVLQQNGPVQRAALGESHGCSLAPGGTLSCWGNNNWGEVGDSTLNPRLLPTPVQGGGGYTEVGVGRNNSCGIRNGDWVCWGDLLPSSQVPILFGAGPFHSLAVGEIHSCALRPDGAAWCLGADFNGQLGDGGTGFLSSPVAVGGGHHFAALALGFRHSCGVDSAGAAWCWGSNESGQLGDGSTSDQHLPIAVTGAPVLASLTAGAAHSCGLTSAGQAWCWGSNYGGQIGDGSSSDRLQPVAISGALRFSRLAGGGGHTCGIALPDGKVYCWGSNDLGSLGDGTTIGHSTPALVHGS